MCDRDHFTSIEAAFVNNNCVVCVITRDAIFLLKIFHVLIDSSTEETGNHSLEYSRVNRYTDRYHSGLNDAKRTLLSHRCSKNANSGFCPYSLVYMYYRP